MPRRPDLVPRPCPSRILLCWLVLGSQSPRLCLFLHTVPCTSILGERLTEGVQLASIQHCIGKHLFEMPVVLCGNSMFRSFAFCHTMIFFLLLSPQIICLKIKKCFNLSLNLSIHPSIFPSILKQTIP